MSHFQWVKAQLSRCINEYEASGPFEPVPLIVVGSRKFVTLAGASTGGVAFRYQCDSDELEEEDYYWI